MPALFGLDCPHCRHDTAKGYRLRFRIRRTMQCMACGTTGTALPPRIHGKPVAGWLSRLELSRFGDPETDWYGCVCGSQWRRAFLRERNDLVFRADQLQSAQSQMRILGASRELAPGTAHLIEEHHSIPPGYDARLLLLQQEPLPRTAVYFRWNPEVGQILTPDLAFQCRFGPYATAAERRCAPEVKLTPEQLDEITQYNRNGAVVAVVSSVRCQHCLQPLPLRVFSTVSLREVEKGD